MGFDSRPRARAFPETRVSVALPLPQSGWGNATVTGGPGGHWSPRAGPGAAAPVTGRAGPGAAAPVARRRGCNSGRGWRWWPH